MTRSWTAAAAAVSLAALVAAVALDRLAPFPSADVARGSDDAFLSGLHPRELAGAPKRPQRWTTARVEARFSSLPPGPRTLVVALHQHREPVAVVADGEIVGTLAPGTNEGRFSVRDSTRGAVTVELRLTTFQAGDGRRLGALLDRIALEHAPAGPLSVRLVAQLVAPTLAVLLGAAAAGATPAVGAAAALVSLVLQASLLFPLGLLRSGYATTLGLLLAGAALSAACFARWRGAPAAFTALALACAVHIVLVSPMVVMSDAMLHANKLRQVAGGDFFPVSLTQNSPPFRFPYGFIFYLLLAPLLRLGGDPVALVRAGAAVSGVVMAGALYVIAEARPRQALLGVAMLLALPVTADTFAYGNLSNVFGQAATVAFVAWWVAPRPAPALGVTLMVFAGLAHLSSFVVLAVLVAELVWLGRPLASLGRPRVAAVAIAAAVTAGYYAKFLPLVIEQLGRLAEGGSGGRTLGAAGAVAHQLGEAVLRWGWPAILLCLAGRLGPSTSEPGRTLRAVALMGVVLAAAAAVSPLEVRYLYAMGFAVALLAASGAERLASSSRLGSAVSVALVAAAWAFQIQALADIVLRRYRL